MRRPRQRARHEHDPAERFRPTSTKTSTPPPTHLSRPSSETAIVTNAERRRLVGNVRRRPRPLCEQCVVCRGRCRGRRRIVEIGARRTSAPNPGCGLGLDQEVRTSCEKKMGMDGASKVGRYVKVSREHLSSRRRETDLLGGQKTCDLVHDGLSIGGGRKPPRRLQGRCAVADQCPEVRAGGPRLGLGGVAQVGRSVDLRAA